MNTNSLEKCLQLVKEDKFLYSPYCGRATWSPENRFYLNSEPIAILYFIRAKIARLIQNLSNGLKEGSLDTDCIVVNIHYESLIKQLINHAGQVLAASSIGGIMADSFIGDDMPETDNFHELTCFKSALYANDLLHTLYGLGHEFFIGFMDLLDILGEEDSILEKLEGAMREEISDVDTLISLLTDDDLRQLYGAFIEVSIAVCSFDTFLLLARETGYLFNTLYLPLQYHNQGGEFCFYILHDYLFVTSYCNKHHDRLTEEEALLWDVVRTFEEKRLDCIYILDSDDGFTILSDGSKAFYQNFGGFSAPYTGENIYFGLYVNSFSELARLLKERHVEVEGGYVP